MGKVTALSITALVLALCFMLTAAAGAVEAAPVITATGASIRIPEGSAKGGIRFKMTVDTPFPDGVEIVGQGTLVIPFYIIGENDLSLDTENVLKIVKAENKYYSYQDTCYEFTGALTDIPVYNFKSTICARGYIIYTVDGSETKVEYSDTLIYDLPYPL